MHGMHNKSTAIHRIEAMVTPVLQNLGYEIVQLKWVSQWGKKTLQVMLEREDGSAVTLDDCAQASKHISAELDRADVGEGSYDLEVSSAGIERPLTRLKDFERFAGKKIKLVLQAPFHNKKRFAGVLQGIKGEEVIIVLEGGVQHFPYNTIYSAHLVYTPDA